MTYHFTWGECRPPSGWRRAGSGWSYLRDPYQQTTWLNSTQWARTYPQSLTSSSHLQQKIYLTKIKFNRVLTFSKWEVFNFLKFGKLFKNSEKNPHNQICILIVSLWIFLDFFQIVVQFLNNKFVNFIY